MDASAHNLADKVSTPW